MKVTSLKKDAILPTLQTALAAINGKYGAGWQASESRPQWRKNE